MVLNNLNVLYMESNNNDSIIHIFNQGVTNNNTPKLVGVGMPNATVVVTSKDGKITYGQTVINENGDWSLQMPSLKDATHDLVIKSSLQYGDFNSTNQTQFNVTIDTKAPTPPTIDSILEDFGVTSKIVKNGGGTIDNQLELRGSKAEKGAKVLIYLDGAVMGETVADNNGNWKISDVFVYKGRNELTVTTVDKAGNESQPSKPYIIEAETRIQQGYGYPYFIQTMNGKDYIVESDQFEANKYPSKIAGRAPRDALIVEVYDNDTLLGKANVINGGWTLPITKQLSLGAHEIRTVVKMNNDENDNIYSGEGLYVVENAVEAKVLYIEANTSEHLNLVFPQGVTNDNTPKLVGLGTPNATVVVTSKDGKITYGQTVIDENGDWSLQMPSLKDATHDFIIKSSLQCGDSKSTYSAYVATNQTQFNVTVDTKAPTPPTIDSVLEDLGVTSRIVKNGGGTIDNRLEIRGSKAEKGAKVLIYLDGNAIGETVADNNGNWKISDVFVYKGMNQFTVTTVDKAGNESQQSKPYTIEAETRIQQEPGHPYFIQTMNGKDYLVEGAQVEANKYPTKMAGKVPPDALIVEVYDNGTLLGKANVINGGWTLPFTKNLSLGMHEITTIVRMSNHEDDFYQGSSLNVVENAVEAKVLYVEANTSETITFVHPQGVTNDNTPKLVGLGTPNATVVVTSKDGKITYGQTVIDENGDWSLQMPSLKDATHDLIIKSSLLRGDFESSYSSYVATNQTQFNVTVDTKAQTIKPFANVFEDDFMFIIDNDSNNGDIVSLLNLSSNSIQESYSGSRKLESSNERELYQLNRDDLFADGHEIVMNDNVVDNVKSLDQFKISPDATSYIPIEFKSLNSELFLSNLMIDS